MSGTGKVTVALPGLNLPPVAPATPGSHPKNPRPRRKRVAVTATIIGLVVALAASTFAVVTLITRDEATAEVYLEAVAKRGSDPFTPSVTNDTGELTNSYEATGSTGDNVVLTVTGDEPGLYGGTRDEQSCDPTKLVEFLEAQPSKAAAWADVLGIKRVMIADYIKNLTPVVLRADTRVTNHGYANGKSTPRQAVLQAGSAVLVDTTGVPRVRCSCGNPLTEPEPVAPAYTGNRWPTFNEQRVVAITSGQNTETFILTDITTGDEYDQPTGDVTIPTVELIDCSVGCTITGEINFKHPTWGLSTLVTMKSGGDFPFGRIRMVVVDENQQVQWSRDWTGYELLAPAPVPTDITGHLFVNFNPGRYNGVIILDPVPGGFRDFESLPTDGGNGYNTRFYDAEATDLDADGQYEIDVGLHDCNTPPCTPMHTIFRWNGRDYV
ncbi:MAG: hypothetical protein EXQ69_03240 [Acidimicrobiia bacterium]|nr:hypothetical protein [Acidimicrobiia bacterium]